MSLPPDPNRRFVGPPKVDPSTVDLSLQTGTVHQKCQAIIDAVLSNVGPNWIESRALGQLGRLHQQTLSTTTLTRLHQLTQHPDTAGPAADALEDIAHFTPTQNLPEPTPKTGI